MRTELTTSNCTTVGHLVTFPHIKPISLLSPPVQLNTANQQHFQAIGLGSLPIQVPNGDAYSELVLYNVLHAPSVAYTLVSLGALDAEGYHMSIAEGYLEILDQHLQKRHFHIWIYMHAPGTKDVIGLVSHIWSVNNHEQLYMD